MGFGTQGVVGADRPPAAPAGDRIGLLSDCMALCKAGYQDPAQLNAPRRDAGPQGAPTYRGIGTRRPYLLDGMLTP